MLSGCAVGARLCRLVDTHPVQIVRVAVAPHRRPRWDVGHCLLSRQATQVAAGTSSMRRGVCSPQERTRSVCALEQRKASTAAS